MGERAVIASNLAAFEYRYAGGLAGLRIAGQFSNNLSSDGENIALLDALGNAIRDFTYNDQSPWPEGADGDGYALVLINPTANPNHGNPMNWRSGMVPNGPPGNSDGTKFSGDPQADLDGNGIADFYQYALAPPGGTPMEPVAGVENFTVNEATSPYMTFTFTRNRAADDVYYAVEVSPDLDKWIRDAGLLVLVSRVDHSDGTETLTYRTARPVTEYAALFARLAVETRASQSVRLAVTQIHYHPAMPTPDEELLGFASSKEFEYIEVMNIDSETADLTGVRFTAGIDFDFDLGSVHSLAPGERVIIAGNQAAFRHRVKANIVTAVLQE